MWSVALVSITHNLEMIEKQARSIPTILVVGVRVPGEIKVSTLSYCLSIKDGALVMG